MPQQSDWRYCQKCHAMFYDGFGNKGNCPPSGGGHVAQGLNFTLLYGEPSTAPAQTNWRFCNKCCVMFYDGYADKGTCPAGGGHSAQGIIFSLPHSVPSSANAQGDWRYCQKCHAMFYDGYGDKGNCPAGGGGHVAQGLNFTLPHSDSTLYFIKPSWSSSFAGAKITKDNRLWRQEIGLGGRADVGIMGVAVWNGITFKLNNPKIATISPDAPVSENMAGGGPRLAFQVIGQNMGEAELTAYRGPELVASMQIAVSGIADKNPVYVDDYIDFVYDVSYKAEGGNYSKYIILRYVDDVVIDLNIDTISDAKMSSDLAVLAIKNGQMRDGRRFPSVLNASTAPKLAAAKRQTIEIMYSYLSQAVVNDLIGAVSKMVFYISLYQMAAGSGVAVFRILGREGIKGSLRLLADIPAAIRAFFGKGGANVGREALNAIRAASPELANLTDEELLAIRAYSGENWAQINLALRSGNTTNPLARNMLAGLSKLPGYSGRVVRSESLAIEEAVARYVPGKPFTPEGFLSTSSKAAAAQREGNVAISINAIGRSGKDISKIAQHGESEVLFSPGTRFVVEKAVRVGDALLVELREL